MKNIIIWGLPGVGKSTIGPILAKRLMKTFIDTDTLIEKQCSMSCRDYYREKGEAAFRLSEKEVITSLMGESNKVIALGGGAVESSSVCAIIRDLGIVVHLTASVETLINRKIHQDNPAHVTCRNDYLKLAERRLRKMVVLSDINIVVNEQNPEDTVDQIALELTRDQYGE